MTAPRVRIARGAPDPVEIAALVAALVGLRGDPPPPAPPAAPGWADPAGALRLDDRPGHWSWARAGLP